MESVLTKNLQQHSVDAAYEISGFLRGRDGLHILVAEDHPVVREAIVRALGALGFSNISIACNGTELVSQAKKTEPNIIISDVNMPGLNGPAALDQIPSTLCMLISGLPFPQAWCEANAERLLACIRKPFRIEEIETAMNAAKVLLE